jgi:hypothetical protein
MRTSLVSSSLKLRITAVLRPNLPTALVSDGRVHCPHGSGDVDVDWCYTCPSFGGTHQDARGSNWVRCSGRR